MGKPQVDQLVGKNSNHSMKPNTSKEKMSAPMSLNKIEKKKRRRRSKTNKNIRKLFDELRSSSTSLSTSENTVIELDVTEDQEAGAKRKLSETNVDRNSKKRKDRNNSLIIIHDDHDLVTNYNACSGSTSTTPKKTSTIQCSTPIINKDSKVLQDLIISNFPSSKNNNSNIAQNLNNEIADLTKEINRDSYLTIDLTSETLNGSTSKNQNTVIDLVNSTDNADCTVVSFSNTNLSMSGDSDVTVINVKDRKKEKEMRKFASGIAKMDATEKGRLLELITQNIFSGCNMHSRNKGQSIKVSQNQATETAEDTYIKEVIVGQTNSRNSIGSNIYNPERDIRNKTGLRMIVIDGSNVAMEHGRGKIFSVKGLKICIDYFLKRGHVVKAFVPRFRCKFGKSSEPRLLDDLERRGLVVYTPSREIQGRTVSAYDDRYIVQCAAEFDGVIVSGDNYRDLLRENPRWRFVIENRLLQFTWVEDMIMFPRDPLGRNGPTLENFLRHPAQPNPILKI